jgi:hypothetical protein
LRPSWRLLACVPLPFAPARQRSHSFCSRCK